jgi:peroxiredoxin
MTNSIHPGQPAIDFTRPDLNGRDVTLSTIYSEKIVYLVFNRGFACPFCRRHMQQLIADYPQFMQCNTEVITLGPNSAAEHIRFWKAHQVPFIGIPDPGSRTADLYLQEVNLLKLGRMPAVFIIDRQGIIRYLHYGNSMADIPSNSEILATIDHL